MAVDINQATQPIVMAALAKDRVTSGEGISLNISKRVRQAQLRASMALKDKLLQKGTNQLKQRFEKKFGAGSFDKFFNQIRSDNYKNILKGGLRNNPEEIIKDNAFINDPAFREQYKYFMEGQTRVLESANSALSRYAMEELRGGSEWADYNAPEILKGMDIIPEADSNLNDISDDTLYRQAAIGEVKADKIDKYAKKAMDYNKQLSQNMKKMTAEDIAGGLK